MKKVLLFGLSLLMVTTMSFAQDRTVSGKVTSTDDGSTLPGVNVVVKGTTQGGVTDMDGNYKITVPEEGGTLVFSFIGLETQEVEIGARSVIDMQMESDVQQLGEVVVTAVGIEVNKASIGYAIQNVDADEIRGAQETNLVNALNSKVAGVSVVSSAGTPGASSTIRIRGAVSISGNNSPLFVIDGIPIDNSSFGGGTDGVNRSNRAVDVNPNDIASLTVLKGAAATVLYGIRAANGAIIITTKKGKSGAPKVSFSSSVRMDEVNKLPVLQNTYAQGRSVNGDLTYRGPETGEGNSWGPKIADLEFDGDATYEYDKNGRLVAEGSGNGNPAKAYDNLGNFFVQGYTTDNSLSVSGGTDIVNYYFSAGHLEQSGIIPEADFSRTSLRATVSADLSEKLNVSMSANYIKSGGYRVQQGSNVSGIALTLFRNTPTFDAANGYTNGRDAANDVSTYEFADGSQRAYRGGVYDSPFWVVKNNPFEDVVNRIIGYTALDYKISDWLSASYKIGLDTYSERVNTAFNIGSATLTVGQVNQFLRSSTDLNSDFLLKFNKNITEDISINGLIGHNYYSNEVITQRTIGTTLSVPKFYHISNATDIEGFETVSRRKLHGAFAQANVAWQETVFLNLSARNDWSSILPEDANSVFYPAVSMGYVFSNTLGITDSPIFSYGKLRASWGQVGNDGGSSFIYVTNPYFSRATFGGDGFISTGGAFPAFGINSFDRDRLLANSSLRPELTTTLELGAEIKLFKGRLGIDFTYYDTRTTDAIIAVDVAASSGFTSAVQNAAVITNEGIEIVLDGSIIKTDDFNWDMVVNFTRARNIVESLADGVETISMGGFTSVSSRAVAGEPFGALYGEKFERNAADQLVIGADGWPIVSDEEGVIGDPNPDWIAGIRNTFSYKGFSLSALLDIRQGGDVWNGTYGVLKTFGMSQVTAEQRETKGFVFDGVLENGTPNSIPVDFYNPRFEVSQNKWNRYGFGGTPEENIQDASWVRLREVTLAYRLPQSVLSNTFIDDLSISLSGRNLLLFTEYNGIDPETNLAGSSLNAIGLDYFNNPNTKSYAITLSATF